MISRNVILALALVTISNLHVAFARLGNSHAHGPVLPTDRLQKVRKAHHTRRHLADETGMGIANQLKIIDNLNYKAKELVNQIEMAITWQTEDGA